MYGTNVSRIIEQDEGEAYIGRVPEICGCMIQ